MPYDLDVGSRTKDNKGKRSFAKSSRTKISFKKLMSMKLLLPLLAFCLALGSVCAAQTVADDHAGRKVIRSQNPDYPSVLKALGIRGRVRLIVKVLANGTVADVSILGGNPILAESAVKAVTTWKYAPAASPSNETVTFDFNGR